MTYLPIAVSEWNDPDGHVSDCGWRSALMAANKASLGAFPATQAESELIGKDATSDGFAWGKLTAA